jgi:diacylglycerol kinase
MFERWSYLGYTLLFCLPPLALIWLRREFSGRIARDLRRIAGATLVLTLYGCLIWPVAMRMGAWAYAGDRVLGLKLLGWVHLEDAVWWLLVSFLMASFVALSTRYEDEGVDLILREAGRPWRAFGHAFRGLRIVRLERNATIHVAAAILVVLAAALLRVSAVEWMALVLAIASVVSMEIMNSVIERIASRLEPGQDEGIRLIKDAAAAGVLVTAAAAAAIGLVVFAPRILPALL